MGAIKYFGLPNRNLTRYIGPEFLGNNKYVGISLAINGCLYCAPYNAQRVLKIDPVNGTVTEIGYSYTGNSKWFGIAAHTNGKLYCAPELASDYLEIDPLTDTTRLIANPFGSRCRGIAFHPNGKLYSWRDNGMGGSGTAAISEYNKLLEFDPVSETFNLVGTDDLTDSLGNGIAGTILGKNNKIYHGIRNKRRIYSYDPSTGVVEMESLSNIGGNNSHYGGMCIVQENRKIYYAGYIDQGSTNTLDVDTRARTTATGNQATGAGGGRMSSIAQAPNGFLFAAPLNNLKVTRHDIAINTDSPFGMNLGTMTNKYSSIAVAGNGRLYCAPLNAPQVLEIFGQGEFSSFSEVYGFNSGNEPTTYMRGL